MSTVTIFLIILAAVVALGLALGQYYFVKKQSGWQWYSILRFITYFCVFLLLINPKFKQKSYTLQKPDLVVAVDNSKSIDYFKSADSVRFFVNELRQNKNLKKAFNLRVYIFGNSFESADSLSFSEDKTNISNAFFNLQKLYKKGVAPTILISDGNQTFGQDYEYRAQQYQQSIYPVVVGDTNTYIDLKIARLNTNRYAFLNNKFPVEVFVNYDGNKAVTQKLTITQKDRVLFEKNITFDKTKSSTIIKTHLSANEVGVQTFEVTINPLQDEKNKVNNSRKFAVEVIDQKTKILLLSAAPHPDLGNLKKAVERNQQRQAEIRYIGKDDIDFGQYQLVILYQPNATFKAAFDKINQLELNTLFITGLHTDYSFLNKNQNFFTKELQNDIEDYLPVYNSSFGSFQFPDIGFDDFPPLKDKFGDITMNTAYQTLLFQNIDGIKTDFPLLATVEKGKNRYGFLFGEGIWQWRAKNYRDTDSFEEFDEFIDKMIQYLASNKRKERLSVSHKSFYNSGDNIIFKALYFDETYQFDSRSNVFVDVTNKDTKAKKHLPFLLKNDRYELNLSSLKPGDYNFTVGVEGHNISKSGSFTIIDFDVEKQFLNANAPKLRQASNSDLYSLKNPQALIEDLLAKDQYKPIQKEQVKTSPLIDWWYLLGVILLTLSIEWFMRKYKGLI